MTAKAPVRRCAVYTRKSSEERLEQDFNSLHAQREACEAFIRSQRGEGWRLIETAYDDCGLSGGTLGGGPCGRRSALRSWRELLLDLKRRGLVIGPELAVADGALGFWQVIEEVWPKTRGQRCWVHKTANVLNKLPESQQAKAKRALHEIWMAATRNDAEAAFDAFVETYAVKYSKAVDCLSKDRATLLAFYDFPAEHWKHLRTSNPIESSFATVRHRTVRSKGCLSNKTALAMIFTLAQAAEKSWRRLDGHNQLPKVIQGVEFVDGIEAVRQQPQAAA